MQEIQQKDGRERWREISNMEDFTKAVEDDENAAVAVFKDSTVHTKDGKKYAVDKKGTWRRIESKQSWGDCS